jgi:hypothetical protein
MKSFSERTPFDFHVRDIAQTPGMSYYRVEAQINRVGKAISNPIFVSRPEETITTRNRL